MSSGAGALSLGCLVVTGCIAGWGIFSRHFDDSLVQRVGLAIVSTGCATRAWERITTDVPDPPPALLWSQIGLMVYSVGTVLRFWMAAKRRPTRRRRGLHA